MPLRVEPVRDRKLHRLIKTTAERVVRKGEVLYRRGDAAAAVLILREGHVALRLAASAGERTVAVAGPSELFGEEAMVPGARRPYTAVAGERGILLQLDGPAVRAVLRTSQHTLTTYLEVKERDLHLLRSAVSGSPGPTARERLAAVILDLAERFGHPVGDDLHIPHWFTHRELADLAGAHRSTVTTSLNDWIWRKVLDTRGRSLVVPRAGLAALREEGSGLARSVDPNSRQD
jgi:CRP-like cAMP-binding protein